MAGSYHLQVGGRWVVKSSVLDVSFLQILRIITAAFLSLYYYPLLNSRPAVAGPSRLFYVPYYKSNTRLSIPGTVRFELTDRMTYAAV